VSGILWFDAVPEPAPRALLDGPTDVDVAIVGGGFTGLWTAFYLTRLEPELRIAVIEAATVGHGASGRNGGWCLGALPGMEGLLARPERRDEGLALQRAMFDAVDEVGRVCASEDIDCHYHKGGTLRVATTASQRDALRHHTRTLRSWGFDEADYRWLEPGESAERIGTAANLGAVYSPHCARVQPARLVRGLGNVVEARGVRIFEQTPAIGIEPGRVLTERGDVRARFVVRATEAYTNRLRGHGRKLVPLHSMMIATEPLPPEVWKQIGLRDRETFGDARRIVIYGQRTADDRLAFGGRAGYFFGSGIREDFAPDDRGFARVHQALLGLFPLLERVRITHRWGGALGVPRSWRPSLGLDRETGLARAGGYVGEGVAAANLAGRTLAELIAGADTDRCRLAWVTRESRDWEPEPLRWLAVSAVTRMGDSVDRAEERGRRARLRASVFDWFAGV
jgi:glycine/D-amino acid oxidase-like deaminating enzyme